MLVTLILACAYAPVPDTADTDTAAAIPALRDLAVAERSSCAVTGEGDVWCWGTIPAYRGTGSVYHLPGPTRIDGLPPVDHLSISRNYHCAVFLDGTAGCWDGSAWSWGADDPVVTFDGPLVTMPAVDVVAADYVLFTLSEAGGVSEWFDPATPYEELFTGVTTLDGSASLNVCGLGADGAAVCDPYLTPPTEGAAFASVAVGWARACGLDADGAMTCWTRDGVEDPGPDLPAFTALGLANASACGLTEGGGVTCWGAVDPAVGDLSGLAGLDLLAAAYGHHCAADTDGGVWCWGENLGGQLGAEGAAGGPFEVTGLP